MQVLVWMQLLKKFELMNEWWSLRELLLAWKHSEAIQPVKVESLCFSVLVPGSR
jgi:hypothetical protein